MSRAQDSRARPRGFLPGSGSRQYEDEEEEEKEVYICPGPWAPKPTTDVARRGATHGAQQWRASNESLEKVKRTISNKMVLRYKPH